MRLLSILFLTLAAALARAEWVDYDVPLIPYESVPNFLKYSPEMNLGEVLGVAVNSRGYIMVLESPRFGEQRRSPLPQRHLPVAGVRPRRFFRARDRPERLWLRLLAHDPLRPVRQPVGGRQGREYGGQVRSGRLCDVESRPPARGLRRVRTRHRRRRGPGGRVSSVDRPTWPGTPRTTSMSATAISTRASPRWTSTATGSSPGVPTVPNPASSTCPTACRPTGTATSTWPDRTNRRIQVFDSDGNLLRVMLLNVPYDKSMQPVLGNVNPDLPDATRPWSLCITPGESAIPLGWRRASRPHLQAHAGWRDPGHAGRGRPAVWASSTGFTASTARRKACCTSRT